RHTSTRTTSMGLDQWSFVLEDRTWNLVLACRKCNNEKRDRLANTVALRRLCARNEQIAKKQIDTDPKFLRDFAEWYSRNLSSYIQGLYDQAVADKFPTWSKGGGSSAGQKQ